MKVHGSPLGYLRLWECSVAWQSISGFDIEALYASDGKTIQCPLNGNQVSMCTSLYYLAGTRLAIEDPRKSTVEELDDHMEY